MTTVLLTRHGKVAELCLDNPAKMNAFTVEMLGQLAAHLEVIDHDSSVAAVMLTATGDRAFCTGADINGWGDLSPAEFALIGCAMVTGSSTGWRAWENPRLPF
jgi:enoyl-CoA hydratase